MLPSQADDLAKAQPVYERLAGWPEIHERAKERIRREGGRALPPSLRRYLARIAEETGVPVEYVGFGAAREDTVRVPPVGMGSSPASLSAWNG